MSNLHLLDFAVIGSYFLVLLWISVWAARREKVLSSDYFLAGRDVGWLAVGASLFASNIGSEHLVGLAGTGAASGLAVGHFEWRASSASGGRGRRARRGAFRVDRLLHAAAARMALRAVLPAQRRVHDAGVPGAAVQFLV